MTCFCVCLNKECSTRFYLRFTSYSREERGLRIKYMSSYLKIHVKSLRTGHMEDIVYGLVLWYLSRYIDNSVSGPSEWWDGEEPSILHSVVVLRTRLRPGSVLTVVSVWCTTETERIIKRITTEFFWKFLLKSERVLKVSVLCATGVQRWVEVRRYLVPSCGLLLETVPWGSSWCPKRQNGPVGGLGQTTTRVRS